MKIIEQFVFLRTLNYLRIEHAYSRQFNIYIPAVLTVLFLVLIFWFSEQPNVFGTSGLLSGFSQLLAILAPFFIASLAAVATFAGNDAFDEKFQMQEPVKITVLDQGRWLERHLTLRQFLSLLFGYCSVSSLLLFLVTLVSPIVSKGIATALGEASNAVGNLVLVLFTFVFFHMITATLLGLYYLSDKMHRPN